MQLLGATSSCYKRGRDWENHGWRPAHTQNKWDLISNKPGVVACICNSSYVGGIGRISIWGEPRQKVRSYLKNNIKTKGWQYDSSGIAKVLSSNPSEAGRVRESSGLIKNIYDLILYVCVCMCVCVSYPCLAQGGSDHPFQDWGGHPFPSPLIYYGLGITWFFPSYRLVSVLKAPGMWPFNKKFVGSWASPIRHY
jgi:hypothetical protein